jgi:hypothetical protein
MLASAIAPLWEATTPLTGERGMGWEMSGVALAV